VSRLGPHRDDCIRRLRRIALPGAPLVWAGGLAVACTPAIAAPAESHWSAPAPLTPLTTCAGAGAPQIAFPGASPFTRTGPGGIVWRGSQGPCVASIGADDLPGRARALLSPSRGRAAFDGPTAVAASCRGNIVVLGAQSDPAVVPLTGAMSQAAATAPFPSPSPLGGPAAPVAIGRAYLGDLAIASLGRTDVTGARPILLRMQRHYQTSFGAPTTVAAPRGPVEALTVVLDYRGDALVLWEQRSAGGQRGAIYASRVSSSGHQGPTQRLGPSASQPLLQATISDNGRAIVVWSETSTPRRGPSVTRIYVDVSGPGVHFGRPHLLERLADIAGFRPSAGSVRLVRLSSETVVMAWTGMTAGRYVVRFAPVGVKGVRPPRTLSRGPEDARLADLATGPHAEALAVWTSAPRRGSGFDERHSQILAARGHVAPGFSALAAPPERVAPPGPNAAPNAAYDPLTGRAIAVWQSDTGQPVVDYAVRSETRPARASPSVGACPAGPARSSSKLPLALVLSLCAAAAAAAAAVLLARHRRTSHAR
jgi:hypothetical protein